MMGNEQIDGTGGDREPPVPLRADPLAALRALKLALSERGRPVVDLSMINPDTAPPRVVVDKLMEATMKVENHRYSVARGIRRLREGFAGYYRSCFDTTINPETEVCITSGTKDALVSSLRLLHDRGPVVVVAAPTYPMHRAAVELAGLHPVTFFDSADQDQRLARLEMAVRSSGARLVVLNYPNNPVGSLMTRAGLDRLGQLAEQYDFLVVHDFVYGGMAFPGATTTSFLAQPGLRERTIETYSLSKAFNVPGWRVGAVLGPERLIRPIAALKGKSDYGVFLPLQIAAAHALTAQSGVVREQAELYHRRAQVVVQGLKNAGCAVAAPRGGAFVWAELPAASTFDGHALALRLLETAGIALLPGGVFGADFGRFFRVALVRPETDLASCTRAIGAVLAAEPG